MAKRRQRRVWSDEEKRLIVRQTYAPGVSVSQVARRYDVNTNLVFKWLRDERFQSSGDEAAFLPVEVSQGISPVIGPPGPVADGCIEIDLAGGHRLILNGAFDPERVARLVRELAG